MKLLVNKTDHVKVTVYCYEKDGEIEASHQKSDIPEDVEVVEQVDFIFRKPAYSDSNIIIRNSNLQTEGEETSLNVSAFQENILRTLLIDWTIKDDDGNKIPVNNININNLIPSVARAAVAGVLDLIRL